MRVLLVFTQEIACLYLAVSLVSNKDYMVNATSSPAEDSLNQTSTTNTVATTSSPVSANTAVSSVRKKNAGGSSDVTMPWWIKEVIA